MKCLNWQILVYNKIKCYNFLVIITKLFVIGVTLLRTNKLILTSLFIACGLLLPLAFHSFGMGGRTFLPMHLPVFMGGMLLGWMPGFIIGALTPVLSSLLTGMPPLIPSLPMMVVELALFGLAPGLLYHKNVIIYIFLSP